MLTRSSDNTTYKVSSAKSISRASPPFIYLSPVEMEVRRDNAFQLMQGGAEYAIAGALKLKDQGGWDAVRPALATAMRYAAKLMSSPY